MSGSFLIVITAGCIEEPPELKPSSNFNSQNADGTSTTTEQVETQPDPSSPEDEASLERVLVHPGALSTNDDFSRMRTKIDAGAEPWSSAWTSLSSHGFSQLGQSPAPLSVLKRGGDGQNFGRVIKELQKAYSLALRWKISGDDAYAELAIRFLNDWSATLTEVTGNADRFLAAGLYGYQFANVGEIMSTYEGWAQEDRERLEQMLLTLFYPMSRQFLQQHNGACISNYWANWDLANIAGIMAIGIFTDRVDIYEEALDYLYNGAGNGALLNQLAYLHPGNMGQYQESGRDQGHTTLGVALYGVIAKMAWNQGDDVFAYNNHQLLAQSEYIAKYNLNSQTETVPFTPYGPNCKSIMHVPQYEISSWGRGNNRPAWALIANHYQNRLGIAAPWSTAKAAETYPERLGGGDEPGWTTLTESLDPAALGGAPRGLTARLTGGAVELSWWGAVGAEQYWLKRSTSETGPFTRIQVIGASEDLTHTDTDIQPDQSYYYQVTALSPVGESEPSDTVQIEAGPRLIRHLTFDDRDTGTVPGAVGHALVLDGVDDFIALETGVVSDLSDFTLAGWVYLDSAVDWARLVDFGFDTSRYMSLVPYSAAGETCFMITQISYHGDQTLCARSPGAGRWMHLAVTLSGRTGVLYINGEEARRSGSIALAPFRLGATDQNWIGRSQYGGRLLKGKVDDIRLYSGALSAEAIAELAAMGL